MNQREAQKAIKQVIANEPWLSIEGLHSFEYYKNSAERGRDCFGNETTYREFLENLKKKRNEFGQYWKEFAAACVLLGKMGKVKAPNKWYSSYGLKHLFEKKTGYLPNGVFIVAALHTGFQYKAA